MDGSEAGEYNVQIKPGVGSAAFSLNLTHPDEAKEVYSVTFVSVRQCQLQ